MAQWECHVCPKIFLVFAFFFACFYCTFLYISLLFISLIHSFIFFCIFFFSIIWFCFYSLNVMHLRCHNHYYYIHIGSMRMSCLSEDLYCFAFDLYFCFTFQTLFNVMTIIMRWLCGQMDYTWNNTFELVLSIYCSPEVICQLHVDGGDGGVISMDESHMPLGLSVIAWWPQ